MRKLCATLALAGAVSSSQAVAIGAANEGCHVAVESPGAPLEDNALNDLNKLNALHFAVQFTLLDPTRATNQKNIAGINISSGADRLALDCVYISTEKSPVICSATHVIGRNSGINDMVQYKMPNSLAEPVNFAITWTADGDIRIEGGGTPPHSFKLFQAPTTLYMQADRCQVEFKGNPEK